MIGDGAIIPEHLVKLSACAIDEAAADRFGVWSVVDVADLPEEFTWAGERAVPSIVFPWRSPRGRLTNQLKLDKPFPINGDPRPSKYLQAQGSGALMGVMREDNGSDLVLIVEGTKQAIVAATYIAEGSVFAVAGCRNWSSEGVPTGDLAVVKDKDVVVLFDGDVATNLDVNSAAVALKAAMTPHGVRSVRWVLVPVGSKGDLDGLLGDIDPPARADYLRILIDTAVAEIPKPPRARAVAKPLANRFIDPQKGGLQVRDLFDAVIAAKPLALTSEGGLAIYHGGAYRTKGVWVQTILAEPGFLDQQYHPSLRRTVEEFSVGKLNGMGLHLPDFPTSPLLNLVNGMLDLETGELFPHDPAHMSSVQFPVPWDITATCPIYEAWLETVLPEQMDDLEEVTSQMLDPIRTPSKAVFMFGPSKTGKSTFLRLMEHMVGSENVSAVNLKQLAENRFTSANVFGKVLNAAGELTSDHVEDLSIFKMMTGDDLITADRKYGGQFVFKNRAMFAFAANELPTVGESSRAYSNRVKPFRFSRSFAGAEDPEIERLILEELPGILVRWVGAWQERKARGTEIPTPVDVKTEFDNKSDRVRQWVSDRCEVVVFGGRSENEGGKSASDVKSATKTAPGTIKSDLHKAFNVWAAENGGSAMKLSKVIDRLTSLNGVQEVRLGAAKTRGLNIIFRDHDQDDDTNGGRSGNSEPPLVPRRENQERLVELVKKGLIKGRVASELPLLPPLPSVSLLNNRIRASARFETIPPQKEVS